MILKVGKYIIRNGLENKVILNLFYFFYTPFNRFRKVWLRKLRNDSSVLFKKMKPISKYSSEVVCSLEEASLMTSFGPKLLDGSRLTKKVNIPSLNLYRFKNVLIHEGSSCLLYKDNLIYESYKKEEKFNYGFLEWHDTKYGVIKNLPQEEIEEGFFVAGIGSFNWYHWLIEILPKAMFLNKSPTKTVLVSENLKKYATMLDSLLALINQDINIVYISKEKNYLVQNLYFVNEVNYYTFDVAFTSKIKLDGVFFRQNLLHKMSAIITNNTITAAEQLPKRFYIYRGNYRIPKNQQKLLEVLKKYDFEIVKMEKLNFSNQIQLFRKAEIIVGLSGAAFSNIIFSSQKTKILSFLPSKLSEFSCFSNLAHIFGIDLSYIIYKVDRDQPQNTNDFTIPINKVEEFLKNSIN